MTEPVLALDLGNSHLKACLFAEATGAPSRVLEREASFASWCAELPECRAALSSVRSEAATQEVVEVLRRANIEAVVQPSSGLALEVDTPETTGLDRLYAARAAVELTGAPCVVIDAGTALTVDAARPGAFLGGAIAPGPAVMAKALSDAGARLPEFEVASEMPAALGRSTLGALQAGVVVGFVGAAKELAARVASEAGMENPRIVITGGASSLLKTSFPGATFDPLLVLRGLAFAATR